MYATTVPYVEVLIIKSDYLGYTTDEIFLGGSIYCSKGCGQRASPPIFSSLRLLLKREENGKDAMRMVKSPVEVRGEGECCLNYIENSIPSVKWSGGSGGGGR